MKAVRYLVLTAAIVCCALTSSAHDFSATIDGQTLYFKIVNKEKLTAAVTYEGIRKEKKESGVSGSISIPAKVKDGKDYYTVVGITSKAFSGANKLESVVLPYTIESIGSFAFEGCTELSKVVFPGRPVKFGEGCFFGCKSIADVTLGSDWKAVNFAAFRWSDSLRSITIPAKIEKISGLKTLRSLQAVRVDSNNERFASYEGVLYNKAMTTLYCVPRSYEGVLNVAPGTEKIEKGSLIDCYDITGIVIPESVREFSFRETSRMKELSIITFEGVEAPMTAIADGQEVFLLQVANQAVTLKVPKIAKKDYASRLVVTPGEYLEIGDGNAIPYTVGETELPSVKKIKAMK